MNLSAEAVMAIVATASLLGDILFGLVIWGMKAELRLLRAETKLALAEAENRFYLRINGSYVKKEIYDALNQRVMRVEDREGIA